MNIAREILNDVTLYSPVLKTLGIKTFDKKIDGTTPKIPPLTIHKMFVTDFIGRTLFIKLYH